MQNRKSKASAVDQYIMRTVRNERPETVEDLVKVVRLRYPISEREIVERILSLENQGKLAFGENLTSSSTLRGYLFSAKASWYWVIVALAIGTTAAVFIVTEEAFPFIYARYFFGFIFVLYLPGYCLIRTLFPQRELDNIERIALSIGVSLALVPVTGLLLNYTPWGITLTPVTLALLALTMALATAAVTREHEALVKVNQARNPE